MELKGVSLRLNLVPLQGGKKAKIPGRERMVVCGIFITVASIASLDQQNL